MIVIPSRIEIFQTKPFHVSGEQEGEDWLGHLFPKVNPPALDLLREEKILNNANDCQLARGASYTIHSFWKSPTDGAGVGQTLCGAIYRR